jgi:hypothetical protein
VVLESDGLLAVAVRLQEPVQRPADDGIGDAARLHLRRPHRPVGDIGADLGHAEPRAPRFETVPTAEHTELRIAHACGLVVERGDVRQDQPAGDECVGDFAVGGGRPVAQALQQRQVVSENVVTDQLIGTYQMRKPGIDLPGSIFVDLAGVEIEDDKAMCLGRGVQEPIGFSIYYEPTRDRRKRRRGGDERFYQIGELGHCTSQC